MIYPPHQPDALVLDGPNATPTPLTLESKSSRPEVGIPFESAGATVEALAEEEAIRAAQLAEFDLQTCDIPRFDECAPIQLETRGTSQEIQPRPKPAGLPLAQSGFWARQTIHKNTVAAKLRVAGRVDLADKLEHCHTEYTFQVCGDCGKVGKFANRCDLFYCAECQPRLARDRKEAVQWWVSMIEQPKHVVLTLRNQPDLTRAHVQEARKWLTNLRNRRFCRNWQGGFYSIEVTNEGRGWHLHFHLLVDAKWIDAAELAIQWDDVTNHNGKIVKVKDARGHDYLREVTKYAVKGVDLAKWTPDQIATFITAFDGVKCFGVFGALYGARTEFAEFIASLRNSKPKCTCGSCNVKYYDEAAFISLDLRPNDTSKPRPPPADPNQPDLLPMTAAERMLLNK
jgi:hypothetical protein